MYHKSLPWRSIKRLIVRSKGVFLTCVNWLNMFDCSISVLYPLKKCESLLFCLKSLTLFHMRLALLRHLYFEELCRLLWWCYKVNGWYVNYLRVFLYGIMEKLPIHRPLPLGGIADQRSSAGSDFTSFAFKVAFVKVYVTEMLEILENFLIFFC